MKAYLELSDVKLLEDSTTNVRDLLLVRLSFRLGCRISEALSLAVEDIDFERGTVTIEHLKSHVRLACPDCGARLGKCHVFCPKCGKRVEQAIAKALEHRRRRVLPLDKDTLLLLKEFIKGGGPIRKGDRLIIFGINRHRAWQIIRESADKAGLP